MLRLQFPLPLGGGGTRLKKKNQVGRDACALPDPYEPSWCFNVSVKEHTHFFLGLVPTPLMPKKKRGGKERLHTRATIATPPLRRLRPCLLLLPGGALLADRDGLRTAVSAFGRFFA